MERSTNSSTTILSTAMLPQAPYRYCWRTTLTLRSLLAHAAQHGARSITLPYHESSGSADDRGPLHQRLRLSLLLTTLSLHRSLHTLFLSIRQTIQRHSGLLTLLCVTPLLISSSQRVQASLAQLRSASLSLRRNTIPLLSSFELARIDQFLAAPLQGGRYPLPPLLVLLPLGSSRCLNFEGVFCYRESGSYTLLLLISLPDSCRHSLRFNILLNHLTITPT